MRVKVAMDLHQGLELAGTAASFPERRSETEKLEAEMEPREDQ